MYLNEHYHNENRIMNRFSTGIKLASEGYKDYSVNYKRNQKWKILFHTVLNLRFSKKWFRYVTSPDFNQIFSYRPRIYIKPFRPYISTKFSKRRKVKIILDTYQFLRERKILNTILKKSITISEIKFDKEHIGILRLEYDERFRKEGELVLTFESNKCGKIISVAFSVEKNDIKEWVCLVGCVQGVSKTSFKCAQKSLFGMKPNTFIIYSLQEIMKNLSCNNILATGDEIQVNRKKHFINIKYIHKIRFNYNKFYNELNGIKKNDNWYKLPLKYKQKEISTIKSNKRNLYRKRYNLLKEISQQIKTKINNGLQQSI